MSSTALFQSVGLADGFILRLLWSIVLSTLALPEGDYDVFYECIYLCVCVSCIHVCRYTYCVVLLEAQS